MSGGDGNESESSCRLDLVDLEVDWLFLLYCLSGLILVSSILEAVYHKLESLLVPHDHYLRILRRVFKELVILGTLAFILLVIRDFTSLTHEQFQLIEVAHIWIFLVGFVFVLQALMVMLLTTRVKNRWDKVFLAGPDSCLAEAQSRKIKPRPRLIRYVLGKGRALDNLELMVFRKYFIRACGLPRSFDFSKYLRRFLSNHIVEDVDIGWGSWLLMICVFGVFILVLFATNKNAGLGSGTGGKVDLQLVLGIAMGITVFNLFVALVLIALLERARDMFLHKAGCPDVYRLPEYLESLLSTGRHEFDFVGDTLSSSGYWINQPPVSYDATSNSVAITEAVAEAAISDDGGLDENAKGLYDQSKRSVVPPIRRQSSIRRADSRKGHVQHRHKKVLLNVDALLEEAAAREHLLDIYPGGRPFVLLYVFEFVLLLQCFTVGLLILEIPQQWGRADDDGGGGGSMGVIALGIAVHIGMAFFIFPRIVRTWGLLEAICLMDSDAVEVVSEVLVGQEEVHLVARRFSIAIYDAFLETLDIVVGAFEQEQLEAQRLKPRSRTMSWASRSRSGSGDANSTNADVLLAELSRPRSSSAVGGVLGGFSRGIINAVRSSSFISQKSALSNLGLYMKDENGNTSTEFDEVSAAQLAANADALANMNEVDAVVDEFVNDEEDDDEDDEEHHREHRRLHVDVDVDVDNDGDGEKRRKAEAGQRRTINGNENINNNGNSPQRRPHTYVHNISDGRASPKVKLDAILSDDDDSLKHDSPRIEQPHGHKGMTGTQRANLSRNIASFSMDETPGGIPLEEYTDLVQRFIEQQQQDQLKQSEDKKDLSPRGVRMSSPTRPAADQAVTGFVMMDSERDTTKVLMLTFAKLFRMLDKDSRGLVAAENLPSVLAKDPFRFHISQKQARQLLRTLGCIHGFTLREFIHITHVALRYLSVEGNSGNTNEKVAECFGEQHLYCAVCGHDVPVTQVEDHAQTCGHASPNYALDVAMRATAFINDKVVDTDLELLNPLPWTLKPRRVSVDDGTGRMENLTTTPEFDPVRSPMSQHQVLHIV